MGLRRKRSVVGPRLTAQLVEGGSVEGIPEGDAQAPPRLAIAELRAGEEEGHRTVEDRLGRVQEN